MTIREKLQKGMPVIGTWLQSGSPVIAEIMANYGMDFIAMDMEHTDINEEIFTHCARAIQGQTVPFARVRENDTIAIRRLLDCGAEGIIVPLIETAEQAKAAVASAKYPPQGVRGFAFVRANQWGKDFDRYAASANEKISVIVMIESKLAVENIEEILNVDGVDGIFIGPYDLSGSYGVPGQTSHPLVIEGMNKVLAACKKYHKAAGQHIVLPTEENVKKALQDGYTFLALGMDTVFAAQGIEQMNRFTQNI